MTLRWKIAQALEIRWWRNYLKNKSMAAYLAAKRSYWEQVLKTLQLEIQPGERILDAGCGPAGIFMVLKHCKVQAIDPLVNKYERTLAHFNRGDYPNMNFQNQSLESFEIETTYDKVFCMNAINHVADLQVCLDKIVAATAPNGKLIVSIDVHKSTFLKAVFRAIPGDVLHPHQHGLKDYVQFLEQRECKVIKTICLKPGRIFDYVAMIVEKKKEF